jgi:hypothetical protein
VRVVGSIRSKAVTEISATGSDAEDARRRVTDQIPPDQDLIQMLVTNNRDGTTSATGRIRSNTSTELDAVAPTYEEARDALRAKVPEGYQLLAIGVER